MKFITLLAVFISLNSFAQITITNNDMPSANDTVRWSNTIDQWGIDPTETGANYTWDYSFLTPNTQELDTFFTVTSTPFAYQFFFNNQFVYPAHKASFAMKGQDFDLFGVFSMTTVYDYYKVDNGQFSNVGFGANINGIPASIRNIPVDSIYAFPLNYQDTYTSHGTWVMDVPNTFTYGQSKVRNVNVEGWGTLITPLGTFQALKVKMDIDITDTMAVDSLGINFSFPRPTVTEYHWLANNMRVPVLQINTSFGIITSIKYQDSLRSLLGVEELERMETMIYPNPASEYIIAQSSGEKNPIAFEIYDAEGKMVWSQMANGTFVNVLPTNMLPAGFYILSTIGENSSSRTKFSVIR